ncbi:MAG: hypothetical protein IIA87_02925 [Nanoarchaeota archaeon]|nr:hypothetical protein [Nanoarchaeota archaeon]
MAKRRKNQNSSVWLAEATKAGLNLDFLRRDETKMFEVLDGIGVPRTRVYFPTRSQVKSLRTKRIFNEHSCFCRLVPKDRNLRRPYNVNITSPEELREFCSKYDLSQYSVMLVEKGNVTHSGSIIARDDSPGNPGKCIIELVEGTGEDLLHGLKTPVTVAIEIPGLNWFRTMRYLNNEPTSTEKRLIRDAIKLVGGVRHPFPGYYEFDAYDETRIMFRKYQNPSTAYANI